MHPKYSAVYHNAEKLNCSCIAVVVVLMMFSILRKTVL